MMARLTLCLALALGLAGLAAAPASAEFGFKGVGLALEDANGEHEAQAGSHPFAVTTTIEMNTVPVPASPTCAGPGCELPEGAVRNLEVSLPAGLVGAPRAIPRCSAIEFIADLTAPTCADATALGYAQLKIDFDPLSEDFLKNVPVYNLFPPPGVAARLGFSVLGVRVTIDTLLNQDPPYNIVARPTNIAQATHFYSSRLVVWGDPHSPEHNELRGSCLDEEAITDPGEPPVSLGDCPPPVGERDPFLTSPRSCGKELTTRFRAFSWPKWDLGEGGGLVPGPSLTDTATAQTDAMSGCAALGLAASISARPSSDDVDSASGLQFGLHIDDPGLTNANEGATAGSDIKQAVVTLPEGMTINPSQAEGLEVCSEEDLDGETPTSRFGAGCPAASKVGSIEVETPLLENEIFKGSLFVAEPFDNLADDALIAFYIVIKDPELGLLVTQAAKVEPDPKTGQLVTTTKNMPQLPFSEFRLRFREGARSPLITPPGCGTYEVKAKLTPWANPGAPVSASSSFEIDGGVGGGPCPPGGTPPFEPGFAAGSLNPQAGAHSPFLLRLTRRDGDQDLVRFDSILPRGVLARIAGIPWCPDAAIARASSRDGKEELANPSCPAASRIGSVQAGAGVGSQLTYVPGQVYLAGPFAGAPLSVVGIVPAVAGPFDVGTVLTRQALVVDPVSGEVKVDGSLSDPIPHILAGIPLRVRDIQVAIDRPQFTLNPTSCREMATIAGIWGGGSHPFSLADDFPVIRQARFQAAGCASLGFKPRLGIRLKGSTKRGGHPALRATYVPKPGDANVRRLALTFPRSAFVENANFRTICTRVQYAAGACPKGSIYGQVKAWTPLLDAPLQGPVYLRSSNNPLPDAVFDLKGLIDIEVAVRIDSVKGRLRATVAEAPDAPVSRVVVQMQGGRKGLFVNSRGLCKGANRARARLTAQSGKRATLRPRFRAAGCGKKRRGPRRGKQG